MRTHSLLRSFLVIGFGVLSSCMFAAAGADPLPKSVRGLQGTVEGVVTRAYAEGRIQMRVTKIVSLRGAVKDGKPLVGLTVEVQTRFFKNATGEWECYPQYTAYLKALRRGTKVTITMANWSRDHFDMAGLTPEQMKAVRLKPDKDMVVMPETAKSFRGFVTGTVRGPTLDKMGIKLRIEKIVKTAPGNKAKDNGKGLVGKVVQVVPNYRKDKKLGWVAVPAYVAYLNNLKLDSKITVQIVNWSNQVYFTMQSLPAGADPNAQPRPKIVEKPEPDDEPNEYDAEDANEF